MLPSVLKKLKVETLNLVFDFDWIFYKESNMKLCEPCLWVSYRRPPNLPHWWLLQEVKFKLLYTEVKIKLLYTEVKIKLLFTEDIFL